MQTNQNQLGEEERKKLVDKASQTLWQDAGKPALAYFLEQRNISEDVIKKFNFGYVPLKVNHRCAGRLIFPIYDSYGRLISVSTRHFHRQKKDQGYFWHESFEKSLYLYGLNFAKKNIFRARKAVLVEGEIDTSVLHSHGINIAVGVCGSSLSIFQASILSRYCNELYLMFDGDKAGTASIKRVKEMDKGYSLTDRGMKIIPCQLPEGCDPDEFIIERGSKAVIDLMKSRQSERLFELEMTKG